MVRLRVWRGRGGDWLPALKTSELSSSPPDEGGPLAAPTSRQGRSGIYSGCASRLAVTGAGNVVADRIMVCPYLYIHQPTHLGPRKSSPSSSSSSEA